jgi:hypothetical protein
MKKNSINAHSITKMQKIQKNVEKSINAEKLRKCKKNQKILEM